MKKLHLFIMLLILLSASTAYTAKSCQRKGYDKPRKYDPKVYRFVETCDCPCHRYIHSFVMGICPECKHYHDPGAQKILVHIAKEEKAQERAKYKKH